MGVSLKGFVAATTAPLLVTLAHPARADSASEGSRAGEQVIDLPVEGGATQRVLYDSPVRPRATIVMLPGGTGTIGERKGGGLRHSANFVVRTRSEWVARGYAVLIPDAIERLSLRGARSSSGYGRLVDGLAAYAHAKAPGPVFLLGTSQGSIAAMNGAAQAPPGLIAGVVLTESVSVVGHSGETVFDADPLGVRVPALVVANSDDACDVSPPSMASRIADSMSNSPDAKVLIVSGGIDQSGRPCGSLSPHGYDGVETSVVAAIIAWMHAMGG